MKARSRYLPSAPWTSTGDADEPMAAEWIEPMNPADKDQDVAPATSGDWRRIHHSPLFWIGLAMCLAAIAIYLWSDDLSWRPTR